MVASLAVHLEYFSCLAELALDDGQELADLMTRHRISFAIIAIALEHAHPDIRAIKQSRSSHETPIKVTSGVTLHVPQPV